MEIKEIEIKNFKKFKNLKINVKGDFSIIIGENNSGKTSIFEAIQLWKLCFEKFITRKANSFYNSSVIHMNYSELDFLRISNDYDLFNSGSSLEISILFSEGENKFDLGFEIEKPSSISNAYVRCSKNSKDEFIEFENYMKLLKIRLDKFISIYQTRPISSVIRNEPFMNLGQIQKKLYHGKSYEILRNKLVRFYKIKDDFDDLNDKVSRTLSKNVKFHYRNKHKSNEDEFIKIEVEIDSKSKDLYSQGSGLIQATEIFSTLGITESLINIVLIDEPDSHLHGKVQSSLINELRDYRNCSIFVISHNDHFVSEAEEGELFYLNGNLGEEIVLDPLQQSDFDNIKKDLGGIILSLEKLNSCNKIVFLEGSKDIEKIDSILNAFISSGFGVTINREYVGIQLRGRDNIRHKVDDYSRLLNQFFRRNKDFLCILDKDFCTTETSMLFSETIKRNSNFRGQIFHHSGYCFESTLFKEREKLMLFLFTLYDVDYVLINTFISEFYSNIRDSLRNPASEFYQELEEKYIKQCGNRPEMEKQRFSDFVRESLNDISCVMNKMNIFRFISNFEIKFERFFLYNEADSEETINRFFNAYIDIAIKEKVLLEPFLDLVSLFE